MRVVSLDLPEIEDDDGDEGIQNKELTSASTTEYSEKENLVCTVESEIRPHQKCPSADIYVDRGEDTDPRCRCKISLKSCESRKLVKVGLDYTVTVLTICIRQK